jgi:hypothetical protein
MIDPDNPVVRLCAEGIQAESQHHHADALALYQEAWDTHTGDYEAAIAAHYLAREQDSLAKSHAWNQIALDHALRAPAAAVADFLPSLYLNLGWSNEVLNDPTAARRAYLAGIAALAALSPGPYTDMVREGLTRALARTAGPGEG